jgi:hypothetical protein
VRGPLPEGRTQIENPLFRIVATRHQLSIEVKWNPECVTLVCRKYLFRSTIWSSQALSDHLPGLRSPTAGPRTHSGPLYVNMYRSFDWFGCNCEPERVEWLNTCFLCKWLIVSPLWNPRFHHRMNYYLLINFKPVYIFISVGVLSSNLIFNFKGTHRMCLHPELCESSEQNAIRMLLTECICIPNYANLPNRMPSGCY